MSRPTDHPGVFAPPPLAAFAAVALGLALDRLLPAYILAVLVPRPARLVIGLLSILAGCGLAIAGWKAFMRSGTPVSPYRPAIALVTTGVFAYVRNPIYAGLILIVFGIGFASASDWTLVMTVALALALHFGVVLREERYLETTFGDAYLAYKRRVPRYGWPG